MRLLWLAGALILGAGCTDDHDHDGSHGAADCDDGDDLVFPGAAEVCDGVDNDCDGAIDGSPVDGTVFYADADGDGFGDSAYAQTACTAPDGTVGNAYDCDDGDAAVGDGVALFTDADDDGYGAAPETACPGSGFAAVSGDCDDGDDHAHPDATERCNGVDDDCDGEVDEDVANAPSWHVDADGDGFGDPAEVTVACEAPAGSVDDARDCDDTDADVHPGGVELCDGVDDDCDGTIDLAASDAERWYADADGDGFGGEASLTGCTHPSGYLPTSGDCDDADAAVNPDADEVCDGVDDDCDGTVDLGASDAVVYHADADHDGFGDPAAPVSACLAPSGAVANADDCDDTDGTVLVNRWADGDGDGAGLPGAPVACGAAGAADHADDCDDTDAGVNPAAIEVCDGVDQDCDGAVDDAATDTRTFYVDDDGDGFGEPSATEVACFAPPGFAATADDCDDRDDAVFPGAAEACNGADDDCNGLVDDGAPGLTWYADGDRDGWGTTSATRTSCAAPGPAFTLQLGDCDDTAAGVNPDAFELCDAIDQDCDGVGFPSGAEIPCNGVDDDCAGGDAHDAIVDASGAISGSFTTLQSAIAAASPGDWICVADGDYTGEVVVDKGVNLRAYAGTYTRSNARISGGGASRAVRITADGATLQGFVIADGYVLGDDGAGVLVDGAASVVIRDTAVIDGTTDGDGGGIALRGAVGAQLIGVWLHGDDALDGGGLWASGATDLVLRDSTIDGNRATLYGGGAWIEDSGAVTVDAIAFTGDRGRAMVGGLALSGCDGSTVTASTFTDDDGGLAGGGLYLSECDGAVVSGNAFTGNVVGYQGGGLYLENSDAPTVSGNTFDANRAAINGYGYGGALAIATVDHPNDGLTPTPTADALVDSNSFTGNSADFAGGGLYAQATDRLLLARNTWDTNSAYYGGAALISASLDAGTDTNAFDGNSSTAHGGGVYLDVVDGFGFGGDAFDGNDSPSGGAIWCDGQQTAASFSASLVTFSANTADDVACTATCSSPACP
jgi:parallel beta-helix repeat protein